MEINKNENKKIKITKKTIKKWVKKHAPIICISFATFIILLGVLLALFQAEEELVQYQIKDEKLYTYSGDVRLDFDTSVTLDAKENVTKLTAGEEEMEVYTEPIYYADKKKVVFPNTMSVIFPTDNRLQRKINRYTVIDGTYSSPMAKNVNLSHALIDAFIYDGFDVYFFTEDGKITYGEKIVEVPAFSFVRCEYNGSLYIYNYEKQEMIYEKTVKDVVMAEFNGFSINLSYDNIVVDNEPSLLNKNINALAKLGK